MGLKKREARNPTGKGGWVKGQSGNPAGAQLIRHPRTSTEIDVRELAKRFTRQAIATAAAIMRNRDNPPAVRLSAVDLILKRGHGNPPVTHQNPDGSALDFTKMTDEQLVSNLSRLNTVLAQAPTDDEKRNMN